jgi:vacuole morphology and inheritance protein 14
MMAKLADGTPLLSASTLRTLADKLYEKRKNAAREVRDIALSAVVGLV